MLAEIPFKNVFVCSLLIMDRIKRMPEREWPKWLHGKHVVSSIYCAQDIGHLFDENGKRSEISIYLVEKDFPAKQVQEEVEDD